MHWVTASAAAINIALQSCNYSRRQYCMHLKQSTSLVLQWTSPVLQWKSPMVQHSN
jgi:hypothetical protein